MQKWCCLNSLYEALSRATMKIYMEKIPSSELLMLGSLSEFLPDETASAPTAVCSSKTLTHHGYHKQPHFKETKISL